MLAQFVAIRVGCVDVVDNDNDNNDKEFRTREAPDWNRALLQMLWGAPLPRHVVHMPWEHPTPSVSTKGGPHHGFTFPLGDLQEATATTVGPPLTRCLVKVYLEIASAAAPFLGEWSIQTRASMVSCAQLTIGSRLRWRSITGASGSAPKIRLLEYHSYEDKKALSKTYLGTACTAILPQNLAHVLRAGLVRGNPHSPLALQGAAVGPSPSHVAAQPLALACLP